MPEFIPITVDDALSALSKSNLTIFSLLQRVLQAGNTMVPPEIAAQRNDLVQKARDIAEMLIVNGGHLDQWALEYSTETYRREIVSLIQPLSGFHFNGKQACLEKLEAFSIDAMEKSMEKIIPHFFKLLGIILDADLDRRRSKPAGAEDADSEESDSSSGESENGRTETFASSNSEGGNDDEMGYDGESEGDGMEIDGAPRQQPAAKKKRRKRRTQNRSMRNAALLKIKRVLVAAIIGNSANERFNALQCVVGFFCDSKCVPEAVVELLSHMGVSVSTTTVHNMVTSLVKSAKLRLQTLPRSNIAYDNFDMDFKVAQPTPGNTGFHWSATSATFIPLRSAEPEDVKFTKELHATSPYNKDLDLNDPSCYLD
ncbi:hypothetical protein HGRIS_006811 [Hohenbuehelia grisea]|uniref:Uncharacterized protein n=1 Tax=Hohenbuehelia grisea TaxID=104357 RepID=A0ABR3JBN7_9AGAR